MLYFISPKFRPPSLFKQQSDAAGARLTPLLSSSLAQLATSDNSGYPTCPSDDCVVLRARRIIRAPLAEIFLFFYGLRPACFKKFSNFFFQGGVPPHSRAGQ